LSASINPLFVYSWHRLGSAATRRSANGTRFVEARPRFVDPWLERCAALQRRWVSGSDQHPKIAIPSEFDTVLVVRLTLMPGSRREHLHQRWNAFLSPDFNPRHGPPCRISGHDMSHNLRNLVAEIYSNQQVEEA